MVEASEKISTIEKTPAEIEKPIPAAQLKFLFVSIDALITDLAWQVKNEGHEVKYFIQIKAQTQIGNGFVEKTDDWKQLIDWADVIVFDDIGFGETADKLRKDGKMVVGGGSYLDKLEDDRDFGQNEMKDAGINILPRWNFNNFDTALDFIRKNPDRYVIKPSGSIQDEKELSFVGQDDDGKDLVEILELYKSAWSDKIKNFQLQKFASGVEVAVGVFFNGNDFISPINVNFENKRLFPGDLGPNCYDSDTEVLTKDGWRYFKEISKKDEIATLENGYLSYKKPSRIVKSRYSGDMIKIKSKCIDLLVTPGHNMYVQPRNSNALGFYQAYDRRSLMRADIPLTVQWSGYNKSISIDELRFLGTFLAEGCTTSRNRIILSSKNDIDFIETTIKNLNLHYTKNFNTNGVMNFTIMSDYWYKKLKPLGQANEKYIPSEYKALSTPMLATLYDALFRGDGSIHKIAGTRIYYTTSKRLADDIQEILLKMGTASIIHKRDRTNEISYNSKYKRQANFIGYEIVEKKRTTATIRERHYSIVKNFSGMVYCVTVPSHIIYVRRNGKACWCGQTGEMGTHMFWTLPNKIFWETLGKMKDKLAAAKYVGYIDINCIANARGIYPLEFTARFGYPTISIQMEGVQSNWGNFLAGIARGQKPEFKTKKGFQIGVVIAVPPFPFTDPKTFRKQSEDATVLFKKPTEGVHLGEVKLVNGVWRLAGESGYALVVTGSGTTMEDARKQAYQRVSNIMIPNMFYRTDIGARWTSDSDRLQTWGYLY